MKPPEFDVAPGDRVAVGLPATQVVLFCARLYLFPLFYLFAGAVLASALADRFEVISLDMAVGCGAALGLGFAIWRLRRGGAANRDLQPVILRRL